MGLLQTFDQLSYKKIVSIAVFVSVLFAVPVGVFLVKQQSRINSRAAYEKPKSAQEPKATPGPIPQEAPLVGRAFPWVGKVGDIIWIQGFHFGTNPTDKQLRIGGIEIPEAQITAWEDDMIQAFIPEGVKQGSIVEVRVGSHSVSKSLPLVIYDQSTDLKLRKQGSVLYVENAPDVAKAIIWTGDDEIPTKQHNQEVAMQASGKTIIFDTQGLPVLTVLLLDNSGNMLPYYVDPLEFDF
ncbi:hypothetical protein GYA49_01690 [Candidatus Beckwithbacteria bacterium]|nr:hypothetical protein [Candidatus Beckwithbacteria bacterium]